MYKFELHRKDPAWHLALCVCVCPLYRLSPSLPWLAHKLPELPLLIRSPSPEFQCLSEGCDDSLESNCLSAETVASPGSATSLGLVTYFPSFTHKNRLLYLRTCLGVIIICFIRLFIFHKNVECQSWWHQALHLANGETEAQKLVIEWELEPRSPGPWVSAFASHIVVAFSLLLNSSCASQSLPQQVVCQM